MINRNTFSFRLNIYVVTIISIILLVIFSTLYIISSNLLESSVKESAKYIAERNVNKIDAVIGRSAKIPYNLATVLEKFDLSKTEIVSLLQETVKKNPEIFGAAIAYEPYSFDINKYYFAPYVYRDKNEIKSTNLNNDNYAYFFQDWYQIPKYLDKPIWSEPYFDEGGGNTLMTTYSVPFYKYKDGKKFRGVITIDISLEWLTKIVTDIKVFESGFAFVISSNGSIVTHPNKKFILNETIFSIAEETNNQKMREVGRHMISGKSNFETLSTVSLGEDSKIYYTPFSSNKWSLAVMFPESELYADLHSLSWFILIISVLAIILIIFTITAVSKKLTKPLSAFSTAAKEIGSGKFNAVLPEIETADEIGELQNSFKKMQNELVHYIKDLKTTTAVKEKMESELRIAHQIQMGMVPKIFPPFPDRDDVDLYAFLEPAKEVGGDLYDFFFIDDDKLVLTVGDVAGKGVPASLLMAVTRTLIRSKMIKGVKPAEIVDSINKDLMEDNDSKLFVTLLLCIIDLKTMEVEYTNAGHNYPYIVKKDGTCKQLKTTHGMAVGVFKIKPYESDKIMFDPGDKFVLYSDGVNEAMDKDRNLYDYERFENCMKQTVNMHSKESTALILDDIKKFTNGAEPSDDITLLVFEAK